MNKNELRSAVMHSVDVEQSVLGALLLDNTVWERLDGQLQESDFSLPEHRRVFSAMAKMLDGQLPLDALTLAQSLAGQCEKEYASTAKYLHELVHNTPSAANAQFYAQLLRDYHTRLDLYDICQQITAMAQDAQQAALLDEASRLVMSLVDENAPLDSVQTMQELLPDLLNTIDQRSQGTGGFNSVKTGFGSLDRLTSGLQNGDLVIVAGRPSMGKTTFAVNIAENIAAARGVSLVVSLEMSKAQLAERSLARFAQVNTQKLRTGKLCEMDFSRLANATKRLEALKLVIADDPTLYRVEKIRLTARKLRHEHGRLDVVVIDYLQLMAGDGNNRNEQLSGITRALKLLAKELNCPIVLLSQLSREVEKRVDKRPLLSDLRESGAIEQDADVVIMLYRDEYYNEQSSLEGIAQLLVRKQRMGPVGEVFLRFEGQYSRLLNVDKRSLAQFQDAANQNSVRQFGGGYG